jgi:molybdopterin/thiamine biosynthesis adenylyltransferase
VALSGENFLRYSRQLLMADIGESGQERLLRSRVLVVGLGGLGCPVTLYLAAAGVGQLTLCDPDKVDRTNLQRQILYREADCGSLKVDAARRELTALNPGVELIPYAREADDELLAQVASGQFDVVVDCTDNLAARHRLNRACSPAGVALVSAAAMGWEGQLLTLDFRSRAGPCLACAIPEGSDEPLMNCGNSGVVGPVLGAMGSLQAIAALRMLLGKPVSHGRLQRYDGTSGRWLDLSIRARVDCPVCAASESKN